MFLNVTVILIAYCAGSLSTAVLLSKWYGLSDPRSEGSGNPGASNMLRLAGWKLATMTLAGDLGKGLLVVIAGKFLGLNVIFLSLVMLAVFTGHCFPVFAKFKGGKGVATAAGIFLGLAPKMGLLLAVIWLISLRIFGYASLSSIIASVIAPLLAVYFLGTSYLPITVVLSLFLLIRHRTNIQNLFAGTELKLKSSN